jgi:hypothetical protein
MLPVSFGQRCSGAQAQGVHGEWRAGPETIRCRSTSDGRLRIMSATFRSGLTGAENCISFQRASRVRVPSSIEYPGDRLMVGRSTIPGAEVVEVKECGRNERSLQAG